MKFLKSKVFLGVICVLLAAVIAFAVLPRFYQAQSRTETVVRVTRDVSAGTVLTSAMLSEVEAGAYGLSEKVIRVKSAAVGKVASEPLHAGEFLWSERVMTREDYKKETESESRGLTAGKCLVTVEFPDASAAIAGILRAGDVVDVYACTQDEDRNYSVERSLTGMHVYDVMNSDLESLSVLDKRIEEAEEGDETAYDLCPAFVVFRCTEDEASTLILLEKDSALHLTYKKTEGTK